jgi:hypothetical protein
MSSDQRSTPKTFNDVFSAQRRRHRDRRTPAKLGVPAGGGQGPSGEGTGLLLLIVRSLTCAKKGERLALALLVIFAGHACVQAVTSPQLSEGGEFLTAFVVGDYVVLGRQPRGGPPCVGTARIQRDGMALVRFRRFDGHEVAARGWFDLASPGGGRVLRFRWGENGLKEMTCEVHSDLDNYARITCCWHSANEVTTAPGLEALFSTAWWPDSPPGRSFETTAPRGAR